MGFFYVYIIDDTSLQTDAVNAKVCLGLPGNYIIGWEEKSCVNISSQEAFALIFIGVRGEIFDMPVVWQQHVLD